MNYSNINGKIVLTADATVPVDNAAFRYGYGLFETMLVQDGAIRLGQYHWERLFAGLKQLYFNTPPLMTPQWLEEKVLRLVQKNRLESLCRVRLQMFAGGGGLYGLTTKQPIFVIECFPLEADTLLLNDNGLVAGIAEGLNKSMDTLSNLKSCNALVYAIGARQAKAQQWNDALICNTRGNITESTIANIFWVKNDNIYTPPLAEGCVAGVMRRHVLETIDGITEQALTKETLLDADEVFLTNAVKKIRWVGNIENKRFGCKRAREINGLL